MNTTFSRNLNKYVDLVEKEKDIQSKKNRKENDFSQQL